VGYWVIESSEGIDDSPSTAPQLAENLRGKKPSVVDSVPIY
jgi:hypothetical protein